MIGFISMFNSAEAEELAIRESVNALRHCGNRRLTGQTGLTILIALIADSQPLLRRLPNGFIRQCTRDLMLMERAREWLLEVGE